MIDRGGRGAVEGSSEGWDFFVSYTAVDQTWAEWISWQLEAAGYRVLVQAWDFVAGTNWQIRMQQGMEGARRTVAVLSTAYLSSVYGQNEWQAAHAADPHGFARKLLPVRVEDCRRPGLLRGIVSIDLFDLDPDQASQHLLKHVDRALTGRAKPAVPPDFPVRRINAPANEPAYPANQSDRPALPAIPNDRETLEELLNHQRRTLGADHVDTLATANDLAKALVELGDWQVARSLAEDTLVRRRRVLGAEHADTLHTAGRLVAALIGIGNCQAARSLAEDTLTRQRSVLDADHPHALATA
ncbi:toll/interleukin-1 receptor domain-containing protein, partial [Pseudofrankia sp. EUN1h]|uniref:toll/interleukin-1 receptor domain-containing protein n=2 Tax=Pseudofrankia TaxID=2994363 RepID=UPI000B09E952